MNELRITENFSFWSDRKILCSCCQRVKIDDLFFDHMDLLQRLRMECGPLVVNSGYSCPEYNASVGGAENSMHLEFATDIRPVGGLLDDCAEAAQDFGFTGIGRYETFVHLDRRDLIGRTPAQWDAR